MHVSSLTQLCWTVCDSTDYSPPYSSVYEISKARILEWVAVSFYQQFYLWELPGCFVVKNLPANAEDPGSIESWEDPLEKEMATHYCNLTWEIPWTKEPGRLQFMGLQKSWTRLSD